MMDCDALVELVRATPRLRPASEGAEIHGLIAVDEGLVLYAARPIMHSDGSGPPAGTLAWIRTLNGPRMDSLQERVRSQVDLWPAKEAPPGALRHAAAGTTMVMPFDRIAGLLPLKDCLDRPVIARVVLPRATWRTGLSNFWWQTLSTIGALAVFGALVLWLINRLVTGRLVALEHQVRTGDLDSEPIRVGGNDELTDLGREIEDLRHRLANARDQALDVAKAKAPACS